MSAPTGLEVVTSQAGKDAILGAPEIARRLVGELVNVNNPQIYFVREPDGPAVIEKKGRSDYYFTAPAFEEASPHVQRLFDWIFYRTDGTSVWFESENSLGAELGATLSGNWSRLTRDDGRISPKMFQRWRLSLVSRIERHEPIRVEGGRVRRALQKAGASWPTVRDGDKDALDRRLGFLSLAAAGGQPAKGIAAYDDFAVLRGLGAIRVLASKPTIELEVFGVRVRIIDGKFEMAAGRA
jgi:hypothetical protein